MKRVYVCVTGDLFHYGHVEFFKKAKQYGGYLIVGICTDDDVARYKRRPILSLEERSIVIESCHLVDQVVKAAPPETTEKIILEHQIDIVVASRSYSAEALEAFYGFPQKANILQLVDYEVGISSTDIIKRCYDRFLETEGILPELKP